MRQRCTSLLFQEGGSTPGPSSDDTRSGDDQAVVPLHGRSRSQSRARPKQLRVVGDLRPLPKSSAVFPSLTQPRLDLLHRRQDALQPCSRDWRAYRRRVPLRLNLSRRVRLWDQVFGAGASCTLVRPGPVAATLVITCGAKHAAGARPCWAPWPLSDALGAHPCLGSESATCTGGGRFAQPASRVAGFSPGTSP